MLSAFFYYSWKQVKNGVKVWSHNKVAAQRYHVLARSLGLPWVANDSPCSGPDLCAYHTEQRINLLKNIQKNTKKLGKKQLKHENAIISVIFARL